MMEGLHNWALGVAVTAFVLSAADMLVFQEGIRRLLRLTGGMLLILVMLAPVLTLGGGGLPDWSDYGESVEELKEAYGHAGQEKLTAGIEEELGAYIWDKAQEYGLDCQVQVQVEWDSTGAAVPVEVQLSAPFSQELSSFLETELELGRDRQVWRDDGGTEGQT